MGISGLVAEYIVAIDVTRVRFPADAAFLLFVFGESLSWPGGQQLVANGLGLGFKINWETFLVCGE